MVTIDCLAHTFNWEVSLSFHAWFWLVPFKHWKYSLFHKFSILCFSVIIFFCVLPPITVAHCICIFFKLKEEWLQQYMGKYLEKLLSFCLLNDGSQSSKKVPLSKYPAQKNQGYTQWSQYNTKSIKLVGYRSVQLGSVSNCESISPALVQMKATTTGRQESQQQDNPQQGNDLAGGGHRPFLSPYSSGLIFL